MRFLTHMKRLKWPHVWGQIAKSQPWLTHSCQITISSSYISSFQFAIHVPWFSLLPAKQLWKPKKKIPCVPFVNFPSCPIPMGFLHGNVPFLSHFPPAFSHPWFQAIIPRLGHGSLELLFADLQCRDHLQRCRGLRWCEIHWAEISYPLVI